MKTKLLLTTLIAFICFANFGFSQTVIWSDNFSNSGNWSTYDYNTPTTNYNWHVTTISPLGTYSSPMGVINSTTHTNGFALFDSDYQCDQINGQVVDYVYNNPIDLSNYSNVSIEFQQYYKKWYDITYILFSADGGSTWNTVEVNASLSLGQSTTNPKLESINLSAYLDGQSSVYIGFYFYSPMSLGAQAGCGYAWMVDDVTLKGTLNGIAPTPNFSATPTIIDEGGSVSFTDLSTGSPTSWLWNFGDGQTSTVQNPTHVYNTAGVYDVTLTVTNGFGSNAGYIPSYITVNVAGTPPLAYFEADVTTINQYESVTFSDLSSNSPDTWYWVFNGGTPSTSSDQNPIVTYDNAGLFSVGLWAENAFGYDSLIRYDYITVVNPTIHGITSSFGNGIFVESVYGVPNIFTASSSETGITQSTFYLLDSTNVPIISSQTDFDGIDGWSTTFDMGDSKLNSFVYVEFTDGTNLIDTAICPLIVREKPEWLNRTGSNVIITSIDTPNRIAEMDINVGIFDFTSEVAASDNIVGFGEKPFGFTTNLTFQNSYDFNDGSSQVYQNSASLNYDLNIFNQHPYNNGFTNSSPNTILSPSLNQNFNLGLYSKGSVTKELLNWKSQNVSIPVIGPIKVSFGLGLKLYGGIGAKLIYQKDDFTNQYGFLNLGNDSVSEFSVGAKIEADLRGRIDIISKSFASAEGTLTGIGRIGLAYQYWSQPNFGEDIKFGGDFYIKGKIEFYGLASPIVKSFNNGSDIIGPKQLWPSGNSPKIFGDGFPSSIDMSLYKLINSTNHAKTYEANYQYDMSHQAAQPNFGTRGNKLVTTWIEADTTLQYLFFTTLDTIQNCFTPQVLVTSTAKSISNPKTAVFNNGDAIITWTENRYDVSTVPVGYDISDYLNSQDIMMAIYEASTNSIYTVMPLTSDTYGKAFGEAKVTTGSGNNAMVSWVTQDLSTSTSDINYTNISKTGIQWFMTIPDVITYLPGINHKVDIVYADNTEAIACWINNSDGNDSTITENIVYYSSWDGSNWSSASPLIVGVHFKDISVGFNNGYGAFGYTANWVDTLGSFHEIAGARVYDYFSGDWVEPLDIIDSISVTYNKPVITIDESGKVSFSIQSVNLFNDTLNPDQGNIVLLLNNLPYSSGWQTTVSNLSLLNDTNVFVWTMDAAWGANSTLYFLTQETDTIVGNDATYQPVGGVTFGEQSQGLVLRAATVDNNLNLYQTTLNQNCMPTGIGMGINKILNDFILKQNVPNPASNFTDIEYRIVNKGNVSLKIYDITGKLVIDVANLFLQPGIYNSVIDVSNLENGVYIYTLVENGISHSKRMVIAK
jgi:PKD repeat protein